MFNQCIIAAYTCTGN